VAAPPAADPQRLTATGRGDQRPRRVTRTQPGTVCAVPGPQLTGVSCPPATSKATVVTFAWSALAGCLE
jgi:hypothetical protein